MILQASLGARQDITETGSGGIKDAHMRIDGAFSYRNGKSSVGVS